MSSVLCEKPSTCGQTSCPQYLRPVCATNGRTRRTFSNQCAVRTFNECSNDESKWPRPIIDRKSFSISFVKIDNDDVLGFYDYDD